MDWERATRIACEIGKSSLGERRMDFFRKAADYARMRVEWQLSTPGERILLDEKRKEMHDSFIACCDELSAAMQAQGEDSSWRNELGQDRKEIGDLACYIHLILGLVAR